MALFIDLFIEIKTERRCIKNEKYTGTRNVTLTGKQCQSWDKLKNNNRGFFDIDLIDLKNAFNYCRDPANFGFNWCFVDIINEKWEPCQLEGYKYYLDSCNAYLYIAVGNIILRRI